MLGNLPPAYATLIDFTTAGGVASDNCGLDAASFTLVSQTSNGLCPRTVTRTYSIADSCGNVSSCTQDFIIDDTQAPAITCPVGSTVECFGNLPPAYATLIDFTTASKVSPPTTAAWMRLPSPWCPRPPTASARVPSPAPIPSPTPAAM